MKASHKSPSQPEMNRPILRVARAVSWVLHPFLIAPAAIVLILRLDGMALWPAIGWAGLSVGMIILPVVAVIVYKLARHQVTDADVSMREQRYGFYALALGCMVACLGILSWLGAPRPVLAIFGSGLVTLVVFAVVTRLWLKVSIHTGMLAAVATSVLFFSWRLGLVLAMGTGLVVWSRLVLHRHTPLEILMGLLLASSITGLGMAAAGL